MLVDHFSKHSGRRLPVFRFKLMGCGVKIRMMGGNIPIIDMQPLFSELIVNPLMEAEYLAGCMVSTSPADRGGVIAFFLKHIDLCRQSILSKISPR